APPRGHRRNQVERRAGVQAPYASRPGNTREPDEPGRGRGEEPRPRGARDRCRALAQALRNRLEPRAHQGRQNAEIAAARPLTLALSRRERGLFLENAMNRIVHIALKVDNLERTTQFYEKVFGFKESKTEKVRDHTSRHLSDGAIDLSIMQYDAGTESAESKAAGAGPCIHHFAVEVDDLKEAEKEVKAFGCKIISEPGVIPVKFRAPGGTVCEIVPKGRYKKKSA